MTVTDATVDQLIDIDSKHVWHPFTPMRQWREERPIIIERACGFTLVDVDGKEYIDGYSSLWCNVHGHQVPAIDEAIRAQLGRVAHATMLGAATVPAIQLAEKLVRLANAVAPAAPSALLNKVFYSDSGATATEVAFKMAAGHHFHRGRRDRDLFIAVSGGYHGDTVGAMSVGFLHSMHRPFERMVFRTQRTPAPDVCRVDAPTDDPRQWPSADMARRERVRDAALAWLDQILAAHKNRIAALVIEPLMQGAGGMIEQPEGFLTGVFDRCRANEVLIIADEVATGLARAGAMLACDVERVRPDIVCLAKGLTGGYLPLAATLCTDEIAESFEGEAHENRTLYHGHTYTGNPLAAAAATASLDLMEANDTLGNAARLGAIIRERLKEELHDHPHVGDVRNRGVMTGIEFVRDRYGFCPFDPAERVGARVCAEARRRGAMIRPLGDVLVLNPAPAMDEATLHALLDIVIGTIKSFRFPA